MRSRKRQKVEHESSEEEAGSALEFDGVDGSDAIASGSGSDSGDLVVFEDDVDEEIDVDTDGDGDSDDSVSASEENDDEIEEKQENGIEEKQENGTKVQARGPQSIAGKRPQAQLVTKKSQVKGTTHLHQVDELLEQIRPRRTKREIAADEALHKIKTTIESIPSRGPFLVEAARSKLIRERVAIPFPEPQPAQDSNLKFEYAKPSSINVVGSYPMKTASQAREFLYIDMVVQMPAVIFQPKDYLNYRYFYKRAFYLACLAAGIQSALGKAFQLGFAKHHDDQLRPILIIKPVVSIDHQTAQKWQINILPAIAQDQFPPEKLALNRSCIRTNDADSKDVSEATPSYNSSLRADMLVSAYLKLLHQAAKTCPAYKDACSLGSTWLKQRGFRATSRKGGFASFEWSALTALLLIGGGPGGRPHLNQRYDSLQLFKATLQLFATRDLIKQPLSISGDSAAANVSKNGTPIVWDVARSHNILYKMPVWSYRKLQSEAKATLAMLSDSHFDGFQASFAVKKDHDLLNNDFIFLLREQDFGIAEPSTRLYEDLQRGLSDRIRQINITIDRSKPWVLGAAPPKYDQDSLIKIGLLVNPDTVNRTVDHGPSAEDKPAAAEFRKFWGEKAELRRFKDGSISEALIWDASDKKSTVLEQVIRHILRQRFKAKVDENAAFSSDAYVRMLGISTMPAPLQSAGKAYQKLETDIRGLDGIPLPIRQIAPTSLRRIDMKNKSGTIKPQSIVLQFESSGKWPDDLPAIQRTKIAFLLRVHELFDASIEHAKSAVGLENPANEIMNQAFLDIAYDDGTAFRVRIFHDREQTLLERRLKDKSLDDRSTELAAVALATYKREYVVRPAHAQAMAQLCSRHQALSGTIMLLKKWFASHLLHNHFSEEVVELIAARTFVQPWPWTSATSVQTAFLRTLCWLATWDWRHEPLIVNLREKSQKAEERAAAQTRFEAWRKLDPMMNRVAIFAASSADSDGTTFTLDRPSKVVASRLTALARAASMEIRNQGMNLQAPSLFASPLADYDIVIHLKRGLKQRSADAEYKNLQLDSGANLDNVDFDPCQEYLHELDIAYAGAVAFFSGLPERSVIGGLWTPQTADRTWKVNLAYSTMPVPAADDANAVAKINKPAILAEMARLGGDLIEKIETKP